MVSQVIGADRGVVPELVGRLDIGVLVVDDERRVVIVNQALRDLVRADVVGLDASGARVRAAAGTEGGFELLGSPAPVWGALPGLRPFAAAMELVGSARAGAADGHVRQGTWHAVPSGLMLTVHDVLAEPVGNRSELVAAVLHELRTPLTTLVSTVEYLPEPDAETAPVYELIRRTTYRMRDVLAELASVADLESRGTALDETRVDLGQLVCETVAAWRERHDVDVPVVPVVSGHQLVDGDAHWLAVLVDRLVAVAVTAASPGRPVTVTAVGTADGWTLRLPVDAGLAGDRLFTRTGQQSNATALLLARAVVARHRGGLTVTDRDGRVELCATIPARARS